MVKSSRRDELELLRAVYVAFPVGFYAAQVARAELDPARGNPDDRVRVRVARIADRAAPSAVTPRRIATHTMHNHVAISCVSPELAQLGP